jgi:hypothetical protein
MGWLLCEGARGQQVHRNPFEGRSTAWVRTSADTTFREMVHETTSLMAHGGQRSEHIRITTEQGSYIYYQYATSRALINDELTASVWVKATRPGVQLLARMVLPNERNPNSLGEYMTTMIRGDALRGAGSWFRLELRNPVALAKQQQALLQASLKKSVNIKDAYIDGLILNVYTGPGQTDVWIDDLEIGPLLEPIKPFQTAGREGRQGSVPASPASQQKETRPVLVEQNQEQLLVGGMRFLMRGIHYSDTPLKTLRDAGFNTLWVDANTSPTALQEAVDLGFWLIPSLPGAADEKRLVSDDLLSREITQFPAPEAVLAWDVGSALTNEQTPAVTRTAQLIRSADPGRPVGGDVWDGFQPYSRSLNLLGVHRWPLMTTLELPRYREWLNQRRLLANPDTYLWTWVQTHLPDWYADLVYNTAEKGSDSLNSRGQTPFPQSAKGGFTEPVGPQPEQIRLVTYTALAAGCKGLGFWSDRFLADSHQGRDRLQLLALLNQELEMLEPLLVTVDNAPVWIDTSVPEVKAAVLRSPRGVLVLPMWLGRGAQFVPGQSAAIKVSMVVPQVPKGTLAWEITPADIHSFLSPQRVPGGTKITIPEFGLTSAVVFTADNTLIIRFQEQVRAKRQLAAQWTRDLAQLELSKVLPIEQRLEQAGHKLPDGQELIKKSQGYMRSCEQKWNDHLFSDAYHEAQRALRPIRILMRAQWEEAMRKVDTPVATPYSVSFFTLPRHWELMERINQMKPGSNLLPEGNFELELNKPMRGWILQDPSLDDVQMTARRVSQVEVEPPKAPGVPAAKTPASPAPTVPLAGTRPPPASPAPTAPQAGTKQAPGSTKSAAATATTPPKPSVVLEKPKEGKQCLMLEIKPKNPALPPKALQRTFLGVHSRPVKLPPGSWVEITGWMRIPKAITASADGALLYDSAGGEPFAVRFCESMPWRKFTFYRPVPASGEIHVTLALTGLGKVYFDDIRIEPLNTAPGTMTVSAQPSRNP